MPSYDHSGDPDTGISYNESSNAIQRLLDKLQKRPPQKGMMPVLGKDESDSMSKQSITDLSVKVDELIQMGDYPIQVVRSVVKKYKPSPKTIKRLTPPPKTIRILGPLGKPAKKAALFNLLENLIEFQTDPRPRNNLGEFTGQEEGGPNPNSMYRTYVIAPNTPGMSPNKGSSLGGAVGAPALAVLGGMGGAAGAHAYKSLSDWVKKTSKARK